jgi:hypothetical protein
MTTGGQLSCEIREVLGRGNHIRVETLIQKEDSQRPTELLAPENTELSFLILRLVEFADSILEPFWP